MFIIGLMSGTSVDGIDAALVHIQGAPPRLDWELLAFTHSDYAPRVREVTIEHSCIIELRNVNLSNTRYKHLETNGKKNRSAYA